ncbi:MAG: extracellular solute-binding protein [Chloroflexota bacterium]
MKKLSVMLTLLLVVALALAACAKTEEPTPTEVAEKATEVPTKAEVPSEKEPIVLKLVAMQDDDQQNAYIEQMEAFQKIDGGKWSHVSIELDVVPFRELFPKIETSVAVGADFDILQSDGPDMKHYAWNKVLVDLTDYFTAEEMQQWAPQSVEEGSYAGHFYGPPMMQSCSLMFYNTDYTDEAGINPPQELENSWTMQEALEAWQKTTVDEDGDGVPEVWGVRWGQGTWTGDYEHGIVPRSNGEKGSNTYKFMGDDGITFVGYFDTDEAIEGMQFYQDMHQTWKVTPVEALPQPFSSKQHAFMVTPDNRIGEINRLYPDGSFRYGVTGIPYFKTQLCHTGSWHWGISANIPEEKFEAALAFIKFAAGKEGSTIYYNHVRQLPAHLGLLNELPEYNEYPQQLFRDGLLEFGIPRIQTPGYTEYQQVAAEVFGDAALGGDVADLMHEGATRIEEAVKKYEGWNK